MTRPSMRLSIDARSDRVTLSGDLVVWTLERLSALDATGIDLAALARLDTAGAWELARRRAAGAALTGLSARHANLLATVTAALTVADPQPPAVPPWRRVLQATGRRVTGAGLYLAQLAEYLGRTLAALARALRHPTRFPLTALIHHAQETGLRAVPIVTVMSFLIGVVLAFQGSDQLRQFGAEVFVVDLIAISILRELGILLTAIVVAGRTASALTASIGSMKMRQEVDAMRTLGLDPDMVLVLPRILALVMVLPILGLISAIAGLLGGAVMS